ncbi:TVP38/TMEM64 family protein [Bacillus sp. FSL K6-3431]|uniref:TVP38/TMEM64 family protein n=1 Tax=Bacillus sp. FSL K6-3431 TaxID=2921500 RepID=UPI0030F5E1BB
MIKILLRVISFLAIALLVIWAFNTEWFSILKTADMDEIEAFLGEEQHITVLITFVLMMVQNLFTLVPLILIVAVNILLFGFIHGYFWSLVTSIIGSVVAFILYRYWLQSILGERINKGIKEKIESNGFLFMLYARLIPFVPSSFINIAGGASSIRMFHYLGATVIGNAIYIFLMCLVVNGIITTDFEKYALPISLVALLPFVYFYQKRKMSKRRKKNLPVK